MCCEICINTKIRDSSHYKMTHLRNNFLGLSSRRPLVTLFIKAKDSASMKDENYLKGFCFAK